MGRESESEIISLIKDLQKQVAYLEKKIDMLVGKSAERPSPSRDYSQGPRTYGGAKHYKDKRENSFGLKSARTGRPEDKIHGSDKQRVFPKKNQVFKPNNKKRQGV